MYYKTMLAVAVMAILGGVAAAELQNVEVGGSIRIRGNYFDMDSLGQTSYIQQRTRLNVKADFTQDVSAFIELDSYDVWGEDFRSWYLCGNDFRGADNVDLYQAYIEARNMWGSPLSARVGRQEIALGSQLLVGVNDSGPVFTGLSFDALRLSYTTDLVSIDAIAAKLAESYGDFGEDDVDFYAVYGSYLGIEDVVLDAYWMFVRDDQGVLANMINGTTVDLHTVGLRGSGVIGGFDFEMEAAYQFGDVDGVPSACPAGFGTADVDYGEFAINTEFGYTFDTSWQPRMFVGFAYYGGGDADDSLWSNDVDMPFNRLFSNKTYCAFLDMERNMSNVMMYRLGLQTLPTESLELMLAGIYILADEENKLFNDTDDDIGLGLALIGTYHYSEDLMIRAGYAHCFADEGFETSAGALNGLMPWYGDEDDDCHHLFLETQLSF